MESYSINVKAVFKGKNGSLGYETNKEYCLEIRRGANSPIIIVQNNGDGFCEYESILSFLNNWDCIRKA